VGSSRRGSGGGKDASFVFAKVLARSDMVCAIMRDYWGFMSRGGVLGQLFLDIRLVVLGSSSGVKQYRVQGCEKPKLSDGKNELELHVIAIVPSLELKIFAQ
jgi:hypothetical protein